MEIHRTSHRRGLAAAVAVLALLAFFAPWMADTAPIERVGVLLAIAAACEMTQGFRRATAAGQREAWTNGGLTLAMGVMLVNAPWLAGAAIVVLLAGWFAIDGVRRAVGAVGSLRAGQPAGWTAFTAVGNL